MAIGNYYPLSPSVIDDDLFLGTKSGGNNTVNYTAQTISNYLNTNSKIAIGGQISFKFDIATNVPRTISFPSGGGDGTLFTNITQLVVSIIDVANANITIFLNYLNGSEILLSEQNQPNIFGHYKITGYTQIGISNFYTLDLQVIGGNGTITNNTYYDLNSFVLSSGINIPTFASLTTTGSSGSSTLVSGVLNVPTYTLLGLGGQPQLNGTGFVKVLGTTVSYDNSTYYLASNPNGFITSAALTGYVPYTGATQSIDLGTFNLTANSIIKQGGTSLQYLMADGSVSTAPSSPFVSLTTIGSSGASTLIGGVLNVPTYTLSGLGGVSTNRSLTINGIAYDLSADRTWTVGTVTSVSATGPITSSGGNTPTISTSMATDKLIGRSTAGVGVMEEITIGSGLSLSAGTLTALASGTVTSVGLSMPSAFTVSNSPITGAGTIAVAGAGTASQYIRGDGTLATLPSGGGGGSSVNYYLNGSINASVATYKQLSNTAVIGAGTDFQLIGNGLISQFLTDVGNPNRTEIPGGAWNFEMFFSMSSNGGTPAFYVELLKYDGVTFTSIASSSTIPENITGGTSIDLYLTSLAVPTTPLLVTDRLAIRVYIVNNSGGRTATLHTEDNHLCEIITTFSGGVTSLNGLTANTQYFSTGTTGTDFNISSATDTHTFNLPTASATNRGALSSANWSTFNSKQPQLNGTGFVKASGTTISYDNSTYVKTILNEFPNTSVTGTLTETLLSSFTIPANSLPTDCMPNIKTKFTKSGVANTAICRLKINTVNDFSTATTIATFTFTATAVTAVVNRNPLIKSNLLSIIIATSSVQSDESSTAITQTSGITFNTSSNMYLFIAVQQNSISDTTTLQAIKITN